jgi:hypothetical protein
VGYRHVAAVPALALAAHSASAWAPVRVAAARLCTCACGLEASRGERQSVTTSPYVMPAYFRACSRTAQRSAAQRS